MNEDKNEQTIQGVKKQNELYRFIDWLVLPEELREPKTQEDLSKELGVDKATLSQWKNLKGFWEVVDSKRDLWGKDKTTEVLQAFYKKIKNNPTAPDVQLWLTIFNGFKDTKAVEIDDKRESTHKLDTILAKIMGADEDNKTEPTTA